MTRWDPGYRLALAAGGGLGVVAALAAVCWHSHGPVLFDDIVSSWLLPGKGPWPEHQVATRIVEIATPTNQIVFGALVAGLVLIIWRNVAWAVICLIAPAVAGLAEIVIKFTVDRSRIGAPPGAELFPSGHSTGVSSRTVAIVLVTFAASTNALVRVVAVTAAVAASLAVAASTIVLGDHYPTDAVGGLALGSSTSVLVAWAILGPIRRILRV